MTSRPLPIWHRENPGESARLLVFEAGNVIYPSDDERDPLVTLAGAERMGEFEDAPLLVARWQGMDIYAVSVRRSGTAGGDALTLREVITRAPAELVMLVSTAVQLLHWQRDHRFCGRCGQPTTWHERERALFCGGCEHRWFPRVSPCVIVAIRHHDQVLLAQSHRYAGNFYSLIAGFVEVGESAEEAVHREVAEETGLQVTNVRYVESQAWPFPHQLMLGYIADYASGEVVLEEEELAAAGWFSAADLPTVPGEWTIAGRLIRKALAA